MTAFYLRQEPNCSFKKITSGRKWVGRVVKCADGSYYAKLGRDEFRAASEIAAFDGVVAKHLGFESASALRARNAEVAAKNAEIRAVARHVGREFRAGNSEPLRQMLNKMIGLDKE